MRTIKQFISKTNKVYFYFTRNEICKRFFENAEAEGITFGGKKPTAKETTDLIALLPNGEICYVGWAGHMCYYNCTEGVVRIDYEKYVNNEADYIIRKQGV